MVLRRVGILLGILCGLAGSASAQSIGVYRWQLQPYCNVLTLAVTANGNFFRLEGADDQCGAATAASAIGTAFLNPNGSIGLGLTLVTTLGGSPVHVDAEVSLATLGGTWRDSAGNTGTFTFTPGAGTGGAARPSAATVVQFRMKGLGALAVSDQTAINSWVGPPVYNTGGGTYDASTGTYTVPSAGLYLVTATVRWQAFINDSGQKCISVYVNGSSLEGSTCEAQSTTAPFQIQSISTVVSVAAGSTIGLSASNSAGASTIGPSTNDATFTVTRLR